MLPTDKHHGRHKQQKALQRRAARKSTPMASHQLHVEGGQLDARPAHVGVFVFQQLPEPRRSPCDREALLKLHRAQRRECQPGVIGKRLLLQPVVVLLVLQRGCCSCCGRRCCSRCWFGCTALRDVCMGRGEVVKEAQQHSADVWRQLQERDQRH